MNVRKVASIGRKLLPQRCWSINITAAPSVRGTATSDGSSTVVRLYGSQMARLISSTVRSTSASAGEDAFHIEDYFADRFDYKQPWQHLKHAPVGSYMHLTDDQVQKLIPEGLSGETADEMTFSGANRLMVREPAKLLFRLIEDTEARVRARDTVSIPAGAREGKFVSSPLHVPRLTDRGREWFDCTMRASHYGFELLDKRRPSMKASVERSIDVSLDYDAAQHYHTALWNRIEQRKQSDGGDTFPRKVLLTGPRGVGKSVALSQAVMYARQRGWLVFYVPRGWSLVQEGDYIEPLQHEPGLFDNPTTSAELLRGFYRAHKKQLHSISLQRPETLEKYEYFLQDFREGWTKSLALVGSAANTGGKRKGASSAPNFIRMRAAIEGDDNIPDFDRLDEDVLQDFDFMQWKPNTLGDVVQLGVALRSLSGSICADVIEELKTLPSGGDGPTAVMIAVDQYNCMEVPSAFMYRNQPIIGKDHLCVPRALHCISKKKSETDSWVMPNGGLCICATSFRHPEGQHETFEKELRSVPFAITVPSYGRAEFLAAVSFYVHCQRVPHLSLDDFLGLRMQTGSNPRLLRNEAFGFLLPRAVRQMGAVFDDAELLENYEKQRLGSGGYGNTGDDGAYDSSEKGRRRERKEAPSMKALMDDIAPVR